MTGEEEDRKQTPIRHHAELGAVPEEPRLKITHARAY